MPVSVRVWPQDDWERMVPEAIRKQFPHLIDTIDFLDENPDSREAALSLFWRIYSLSKKQLAPSEEILGKVDNLERKLNKELHEDLKTGVKDTCKFFVYLHVAGCLITTLEKMEPYHSERFTETLKEIENFWDLAYHDKFEDLSEDDPFARSLYALMAIVGVKLFELRDGEGDWQKALSDLVFAIQISETSYAINNLDPQAPVDTFEKLWDSQDRVTSWKELAGYCRELAWDEWLLDKPVNWKGEEQDSHTFWISAESLCKSRCTRSELMRLRDDEEKQASERRLRNYFFYNCWDSIPAPLRDELKSIDRLWFSQEKVNMGGVLESLKIVAEQLIRQILWDPFIKWTDSTRKAGQREEPLKQLLRRHYDDYKKQEYQPTLLNFADMLEHNTFREFNGPRLSLQDGSKFDLSELAQALRELNRERKPRAHPKALRAWQREDVAPLLKKFFGIDCQGILPFLARMLKESSTQNKDRKG